MGRGSLIIFLQCMLVYIHDPPSCKNLTQQMIQLRLSCIVYQLFAPTVDCMDNLTLNQRDPYIQVTSSESCGVGLAKMTRCKDYRVRASGLCLDVSFQTESLVGAVSRQSAQGYQYLRALLTTSCRQARRLPYWALGILRRGRDSVTGANKTEA